jgi:hypothetical protein
MTHPSRTQARIEYTFARQQVLNCSTAGVDSKDSARLWALKLRDSWVSRLCLLYLSSSLYIF